MVVIDIAADLNNEDETGLVWMFLDEARDPSVVVPGAVVVDVVDKPSGRVVHLRLLP